jgi:tRNA A-37 threonylcarbamoyl transferase component Bud32
MGNSHGHSHGQGRGHGHGHAGGESEAKPAPLSGAQEEAASDAMEVAHTDNVDDDDDADAAPPSRSSHRRHSSFRGMYDALTRRKSTESRRSSSLAKDKSQRVKTMDVGARYEIEYKQLGAGHYGVVRKCHRRDTKQAFAIKSIKKSRVSKVETLLREIDILRAVDHPSIIKLYEVYSDDRYIHLITELCTGGELFDRIIKKTETEEGRYSERDAAKVMKRILEGIEYCHNVHNICHRDLKPENFLFLTPNGDDDIKIIDFGLSRFEEANTAMTTRVGTPYYIAPEVLGRHYDKACDLWSLGVITYILLSGYPPFYGDNDQEIFNSVRAGVFEFSSPEWDGIRCAGPHACLPSLLILTFSIQTAVLPPKASSHHFS